MTAVDVVVERPALLGECPVWSEAEQVLYWVDIDGRLVHRYDPATGLDEARSTPGRPGSLVLTSDPGRMLVAIEHELVWLDWASATTDRWLALEEPDTGNRLNDGRCDPAGRYVVGSMWADTAAGKASGQLHQVSGDGTVATVRHGIGVTNGLAFDADRSRMYFADTPTETVLVFDYDLDDGSMRDERVFLDYRDLPGKPDGACVDADGCYWSASVYGWSMIRVTPAGDVDRRIELPVEKPSMPAFGGAGLSTLFVTTIGGGGTHPSAPGRGGVEPGALLAVDAGVSGRPEPRFAVAGPR